MRKKLALVLCIIFLMSTAIVVAKYVKDCCRS